MNEEMKRAIIYLLTEKADNLEKKVNRICNLYLCDKTYKKWIEILQLLDDLDGDQRVLKAKAWKFFFPTKYK